MQANWNPCALPSLLSRPADLSGTEPALQAEAHSSPDSDVGVVGALPLVEPPRADPAVENHDEPPAPWMRQQQGRAVGAGWQWPPLPATFITVPPERLETFARDRLRSGTDPFSLFAADGSGAQCVAEIPPSVPPIGGQIPYFSYPGVVVRAERLEDVRREKEGRLPSGMLEPREPPPPTSLPPQPTSSLFSAYAVPASSARSVLPDHPGSGVGSFFPAVLGDNSILTQLSGYRACLAITGCFDVEKLLGFLRSGLRSRYTDQEKLDGATELLALISEMLDMEGKPEAGFDRHTLGCVMQSGLDWLCRVSRSMTHTESESKYSKGIEGALDENAVNCLLLRAMCQSDRVRDAVLRADSDSGSTMQKTLRLSTKFDLLREVAAGTLAFSVGEQEVLCTLKLAHAHHGPRLVNTIRYHAQQPVKAIVVSDEPRDTTGYAGEQQARLQQPPAGPASPYLPPE